MPAYLMFSEKVLRALDAASRALENLSAGASTRCQLSMARGTITAMAAANKDGPSMGGSAALSISSTGQW